MFEPHGHAGEPGAPQLLGGPQEGDGAQIRTVPTRSRRRAIPVVLTRGGPRAMKDGRLADSQSRWVYRFNEDDQVVSAHAGLRGRPRSKRRAAEAELPPKREALSRSSGHRGPTRARSQRSAEMRATQAAAPGAARAGGQRGRRWHGRGFSSMSAPRIGEPTATGTAGAALDGGQRLSPTSTQSTAQYSNCEQ